MEEVGGGGRRWLGGARGEAAATVAATKARPGHQGVAGAPAALEARDTRATLGAASEGESEVL